MGFSLAILAFLFDQAFKLWLLFGFGIEEVMRQQGPVRLAPFFDVVLVWNRGISYGLFQQDDDMGRYLLIAVAAVASVALIVWLWKSKDWLTTAAVALILGGALGNGLDRILHGAVVDMFHFHVGTFSWYIFNLADVWIVLGAALLVLESLFGGRNSAVKQDLGASSRKDAANE